MTKAMTKRRLVVTGTGIALLACAIVLVYATRPAPFVRAFAQLEIGMTIDEVSAVIGQRPDPPTLINGDHFPAWMLDQRWNSPIILSDKGLPSHQLPLTSRSECWTQKNFLIDAWFDRDGKLLSVKLATSEFTLFDRLRAWLGL